MAKKIWNLVLLSIIAILFFVVLSRCFKYNLVKEVLFSVPTVKPQPTETPQIIKQDVKQKEILSAFQFWVNKKAWCYEDFEYVNEKKTVEIYYEKIESNEFYGHLYFPLQETGKDSYKHYSFYFGKEGFESEPFLEEEIKEVEDDLIYLGKDTFYFSQNNVSKPKFPCASEKKDKFIKKAKKELTKAINSFEFEDKNDKKGKYHVYISNFTNQDTYANVIIIKDNKTMWSSQILSQMQSDDGKTLNDVVYFRGIYSPPCDWSDKNVRKNTEKELELSVCDFIIDIS